MDDCGDCHGLNEKDVQEWVAEELRDRSLQGQTGKLVMKEGKMVFFETKEFKDWLLNRRQNVEFSSTD